jgi:hypothetical protein
MTENLRQHNGHTARTRMDDGTEPPWTEKRLQAQYQRYNRRYWNGELEPCEIVIGRLRHAHGQVGGFTITIDVADHMYDDEVRATLLHEMVHVAVFDYPPHGLTFWKEVNRILGQGAPPQLVLPITRRLRTLLRTTKPKLFYCNMAVSKMDAKEKRTRLWDRENELEHVHWATVTKFRDVAEKFTWTQALRLLGLQAGLVDQFGQPLSRRQAKVLALIKKRFEQERRSQRSTRPSPSLRSRSALCRLIARGH